MTVGMQALNSAGSVQFDTNDFNMYLVSKGTNTTTTFSFAGFTNTGAGSYDLTVTGRTNPMVALRCASKCTVWQAKDNGSGSFTFRIVVFAAPGASFDWYCFDSGGIATENFGLEVYDPSGNRLYSTGRLPMRVRAVIGEPHFDDLTGGDFTYDSGRIYAVVHTKFTGSHVVKDELGFHWDTWLMCMSRNLTNGITLINQIAAKTTSIGGHDEIIYTDDRFEPCFFLVVDVTNY